MLDARDFVEASIEVSIEAIKYATGRLHQKYMPLDLLLDRISTIKKK